MKKIDFSGKAHRINIKDKPITSIISCISNLSCPLITCGQAVKLVLILNFFLEELESIKRKYEFHPEFDLPQYLEELITWIPTYKDSNNNIPRNSNTKKILNEFNTASKNTVNALDKLLDVTTRFGVPIRNLIYKKVQFQTAQIAEKIKDARINNNPVIDLDNLLKSIENLPDLLHYLTAISNTIIDELDSDAGGQTVKSIKINIVFHLAKIYYSGTNKPITNYYNGNFQNFLLDINPLLSLLHPELDLGTHESILKSASEMIKNAHNTNKINRSFLNFIIEK